MLPDYVCADCGASGVRLWREYQTFLEHQVLRCRACAEKHAGKTMIGDQIGWMVLAVPAPGNTYWGYTSVPAEDVAWWKSLPE